MLSSPTCSLSLGLWDTRGDYVTSDAVFTNSSLSWNPATYTLTLTLGTYTSGNLRNASGEKVEYTPTGTRQDIAGNNGGTGKFTSTVDTNF